MSRTGPRAACLACRGLWLLDRGRSRRRSRRFLADGRRRRDAGDREIAFENGRAAPLRDDHSADMHTVPDIEPVELNHQLVGNGVDRAAQLDTVTNYVQDTAAAQTRRHFRIYKRYRYGDPDLGIRAHSHKVDMQWLVGRRVALDVARQGSVHDAIDIDVDQGGKKATISQHARQCARL